MSSIKAVSGKSTSLVSFKIITTRDKLIRIGIDLFSEHGFEATTTRMIADAANANNAAIFFHFGSKENLYAEVLNTVAEQMKVTYQPLQEEIAKARKQGALSPVKAWSFIEKYVDLFINILKNPDNNKVLYLLLHEQLTPVNGHRPITKVACQEGELLLVHLLLEYWEINNPFTATIASRMATSALAALAEHPSFLRLALHLDEDAELPDNAWRDIRSITLNMLHSFVPPQPAV